MGGSDASEGGARECVQAVRLPGRDDGQAQGAEVSAALAGRARQLVSDARGTAGLGGERRRLRVGGHHSRGQAEKALRALQTPCPGTGSAAWTTGRWLRHWLVGRVSLRPNTRRMYESHLRVYLLPHLDRIPLAALTIAELRAMFLTISRHHQALGTPLSAGRCTASGARCGPR